MAVRAYVFIEADQTRVRELQESLTDMTLAGSRVVAVDVVAGQYDLIATVESTDMEQLGR
jgi:uncharacterized protein with GYD domain